MNLITHVEGTVRAYDSVTGIANVEVRGVQIKEVQMHIGAFYSGRLARAPRAGDEVVVEIGQSRQGKQIAVEGRLKL